MAPSKPDYISRLPNEVKSNIVGFLAGHDAADMRLTSSAWRDAACEGLFNVEEIEVYSTTGPRGSVQRGILPIRPYRTLRSVADSLKAWPWLGRSVREVHIYLPDKDLDALETAGKKYLELGNPLASYDRLQEAGSREAAGFDTAAFSEILSSIPHCHTLHALTEKCPWPDHETELHEFWNEYLTADIGHRGEQKFAWKFQEHSAAAIQYSYIVTIALTSKKLNLKQLYLESVPIHAIAHLSHEAINYTTFQPSAEKLRHLQLGIVMDMETIDGSHLTTMPHHFIGLMKNLESLTITWSDRTEIVESWDIYLQNWRALQDTLCRTTWPKLQILRLQDIRMPMTTLKEFVLKHSATLQRLAVAGCFLGYTDREEDMESFDLGIPTDNCRELLLDLRTNGSLKDTRLWFTSYEECFNAPVWTYDYTEPPWFRDDDALLNEFVQGKCSWPMLEDNPDLEWDHEKGTWWTKRGQEKPSYEGRDWDDENESYPRPRKWWRL